MSPPVLLDGLRFVSLPDRPTGEGLLQHAATGMVARVGAVEWTVLQRFDGSSLERVRRRLRAECGFELAPRELELFADAAGRAGLLRASHGRRQRTGLRWHVPIWNPETAFTRMASLAAPAFHPAIVGLGVVIVTMAVVSALTTTHASPSRVSGWWQLAVFVALLNLVSILHECGHGVALHRYGGRAREIGIRFILGWPCWYCDITESYLLPRKVQRIAVLLAGPFVQAVVCGLIVLLARNATPQCVLLRRSAMWLGAFSIANFFPLVPSDGYYLLTELVDVPNLRARAWRWLTSARERRSVRLEQSRFVRATVASYALATCAFVAAAAFRITLAIGKAVAGARPVSIRMGIAAASLTVVLCALVRNSRRSKP